MAACVYRAWGLHTVWGEVAPSSQRLPGLCTVNTDNVHSEPRASQEWERSWGHFYLGVRGEEELPVDWHTAPATAHSDHKFSFRRRASEAPNKGVFFPQPLCFAVLGSGGRRAGKEMIAPFKFLIAYHSIRGKASQHFSSWMIYPGALVFPLPKALGRRVSQ